MFKSFMFPGLLISHGDPSVHLISFSFSLKNFFWHFFLCKSAGKTFSQLLSENILIWPASLKDFFVGYSIADWQSPSPLATHCRNIIQLFWGFVSDEKTVTGLIVLHTLCIFISCLILRVFSSVFSFQQFDYDVSRWDSSHDSPVRGLNLLDLWVDHFHQLWNFSVIMSSNIFSSSISVSLSLKNPNTHFLDCWMSHRLLRFWPFLPQLFSLSPVWIDSIALASCSVPCFPTTSHLPLDPSSGFFISDTIVFIRNFYLVPFLYRFILLWILNIPILL